MKGRPESTQRFFLVHLFDSEVFIQDGGWCSGEAPLVGSKTVLREVYIFFFASTGKCESMVCPNRDTVNGVLGLLGLEARLCFEGSMTSCEHWKMSKHGVPEQGYCQPS